MKKAPVSCHHDRKTGAPPGKGAFHANYFQAVFRRTRNENEKRLVDTCPSAGYLKSMENYFDIATPAEIEDHYGYMPDAEELARDRLVCERDADGNFSMLAVLYYFRGDEAATQRYLDKIQNPERRLETSMSLYECILP